MANILVTGGAGYIGSHVVRELQASGHTPLVLDNFTTGRRVFIPEGVRTFAISTGADVYDLVRELSYASIDAVIHLAGYKFAGESVKEPYDAYTNNVVGIMNLLKALEILGVKVFVNSSSAAVYGQPDGETLITEDSPLRPLSPYGESKLISEWFLRDFYRALNLTQFTNLRYFNVVGSGYPGLYDVSAHNLFPILIRALREGKTPTINGIDFETPDGTCVRDYVHVTDLAKAHVVAVERLLAGDKLEEAYNLGSGSGTSVREIMAAVRIVTGIDFVANDGPRRPGDPARIVASSELAARDLEWENRFTVDEMLKSAWANSPN